MVRQINLNLVQGNNFQYVTTFFCDTVNAYVYNGNERVNLDGATVKVKGHNVNGDIVELGANVSGYNSITFKLKSDSIKNGKFTLWSEIMDKDGNIVTTKPLSVYVIVSDDIVVPSEQDLIIREREEDAYDNASVLPGEGKEHENLRVKHVKMVTT